MAKPRLLDLFCGAGGASMGYHRAGFEVVGVDINPQKDYPFEFIQSDAMTFPLDGFDVIHASPPCQAFTRAQRIMNRKHVNLIPQAREALDRAGVPWVIENVEGSPLISPVMLCGAMFEGLATYRHRLFETGRCSIEQPKHPEHLHPLAKMGRQPKDGEWMHIVGKWVNKEKGVAATGIDWMTGKEMSQAIPPAYTEYVGKFLMEAVNG